MLETIKIKPQTLKEYLKVDFNKSVYNFYHQYFKVKTGVNDIDMTDFFNSVYEIVLTFFSNCYELPYEANNFIIELCKRDEKEILKKYFLILIFTQIKYHSSVKIIPKEKEGFEIVDIHYLLGNNDIWTYHKNWFNFLEKVDKELKEFEDGLCESRIEYVFETFIGMRADNLEKNCKEIQDYCKFLLVESKKTTLIKKTKPILINGVKPNISERYKIANEVLGIYKNINSKNISATEKHKLLAHIMGCNQQTARELFNGTQIKRTSIRDEVINPYLDTLK